MKKIICYLLILLILTSCSKTRLYNVVEVFDGDTIVININNKNETVRLLGIDTPESVHPNPKKNTKYGKIASSFTKKLLTNKKVSIELDVQKKDKYGRILAYVYLNNKMVNETIIENGFAKPLTIAPNVKYTKKFTKLFQKARKYKKGLWSIGYKFK
ncbi:MULTISPECIES: thermonuclease family protein [Helcococcus]|uniref:Thermonuclease family protein n=1 Tax=Helcococcus bovis TaxID=3153252 RepID=A0ABW9F823_9FIRM